MLSCVGNVRGCKCSERQVKNKTICWFFVFCICVAGKLEAKGVPRGQMWNVKSGFGIIVKTARLRLLSFRENLQCLQIFLQCFRKFLQALQISAALAWKKNKFSFVLLSPCTIFGFAQVRLRLGITKEKQVFLCSALALH